MSDQFEEKLIIRYLLGEISEEETILEIEEKIFSDPDFLAEIELIEDGLLDDYANGTLDRNRREKFENFFIKNSPNRRRKLFETFLVKESAENLRPKNTTETFESTKKKPKFILSPQFLFVCTLVSLLVLFAVRFFTPKD